MRRQFRQFIEACLTETGLPWSLETGTKHTKVILAGRMISVLPAKAKEDSRRILNMRALIRREARNDNA